MSNTDPSAVEKLTPSQKEILIAIAEDLTPKEIAARLGIGVNIVEFHRACIKQLIGAKGPAGIARYAIRAGLIQP